MASPVVVSVSHLGGDTLEKEMEPADTIKSLREYVSKAWTLEPNAFRLLLGTLILEDNAEVNSLTPEAGGPVSLQLVKFDPLPLLGQFDTSGHRGIEVTSETPPPTLTKTYGGPDSNNVLLRHAIKQPCFVEFGVNESNDELSFGVTTDPVKVAQTSGYANTSLNTTWIYSKRQSMPDFFFGGHKLNTSARTIRKGDRIAVYVDPHERLVKFYNNSVLVGSNLPDYPLPEFDDERPLRMYVMVDQTRDEVSLLRFGPGEPDFNVTDQQGLSQEEAIRILIQDRIIESEADLDKEITQYGKGRTPVYIAANEGQDAVVNKLVVAKADVNHICEFGRSPLWTACDHKEWDTLTIVNTLIAAKADVNHPDSNGNNPLMNAAGYRGTDAVVNALIAAKADINHISNAGWTPLFDATYQGYETIVRTLIVAKADVDHQNKEGHTALHYAEQQGHTKVAEALRTAGAKDM